MFDQEILRVVRLGFLCAAPPMFAAVAGAQIPCSSAWNYTDTLTFPNDVTPGFTEIDEGSNTTITLHGAPDDFLKLHTMGPGGQAGYFAEGASSLVFPANSTDTGQLVVEFSVAVSSSNSTCPEKEAVTVSITLEPDASNPTQPRGVRLRIGTSNIRIVESDAGPCGATTISSTANDSFFHDYRIVITEPDQSVMNSTYTYTVERDQMDIFPVAGGGLRDVITLTTSSITDFPRISWGATSVDSYGETNWKSFSHNAHACIGLEPVACTPVANSTGNIGKLDAYGSYTATDNDVTLYASNLPPNKIGMFFTSETLLNPPLPLAGSPSHLCLSNVRRYAPQSTESNGEMWLSLNLNAVPGSMGQDTTMSAGETWHFQAWHRDPITGTMLTSNLTRALSVTFN